MPQAELAQTINVLCGAGEDVSFDLALQRRFDCEVMIVDPPPRAVQHWGELRGAAANSHACAVNKGVETYEIQGVDFRKITFLPYAVWTEDTKVEFWAPINQAHVSHSIVNLQGAKDSIFVEARSLASLMVIGGKGLSLGILKLDVEGAATEVLEALLISDLRPMQILAEFEELSMPTVASVARMKNLVLRLVRSGYQIVHFDGVANLSFWRTTA